MFDSNDPLASIAKKLFIPFDRFQEPLQRSGGDVLLNCDRFDVLALHVDEQTSNVDAKQSSPSLSRETVGKNRQKLGKQFSERSDILK